VCEGEERERKSFRMEEEEEERKNLRRRGGEKNLEENGEEGECRTTSLALK
jgi:hypothetical protein